MPEYPQPGGEQRSQQKFVIFDRFERLNTEAARAGLPDNELAWLENLQPLAGNKLQVVPAPAAPAVAALPETIVLQFYATMNNQDWIILFTSFGAGFFYNVTTNAVGQFAPDGTFSAAPDCTTWQASRVLIYDTVASYCTFDGTIFVRAGSVSPNINVTAPGQNYTTAPPVALLVNGSGGVAVSVLSAGAFTAPGAGQVALSIPAPPAGGVQATGFATVVGPSPFKVQSVTITNAGSGYTNPFPVVTLAGAVTGTAPVFSGFLSANGATAAATIDNAGHVVSVFLTNPGMGLAAGDTITVVIGTGAGGGATFAVTMSGAGLAGVNITNNSITLGATTNTFALVIDPPPAGGTQATGTYTLVFLGAGAGAITSATITNPGAGYTSVPGVRPNPSGGIGPASFQARMQPISVVAVAVTNGGAGYPPSTTLPLMFSGGPGITPATGTVTTNAGGNVISVALLTGGNYPFGSTPAATLMVGGGGSGATAAARVWPFVAASSTTATLAVFQGRVFLGSGQLLQWTGTGASAGFGNVGFDDFLLADNAGATLINDADLVHDITALRSLNNYLWVVGDESIKQIGTLFPSGAPPFQLLTLSSDQGTKWPKSCISFNRIFLFANRNGIFGVFGSTVQKISDDLDGIFQHTDFAAGIQGAVIDLNSKHSAVFLVQYRDPVAGMRPLLLLFDGKRWWLGNQGNTLATIVTVPTYTPLINQLWGSITGTDVTQLLADPTTAQPFKLSTALSHNTNPVQGKRLIRSGFTAAAAAAAQVNMLLEADATSLARVLAVSPGSLLVGGANDANNAPMTIAGVYLGATLTGTLANFVLQNVILEYQETSLWKTGILPAPPLPPPVLLSTSSAGVFDANGKLVRTLWSAQTSDPRAVNPAAAWDGRLDDLSTAAAGTYTVKLLQHNITYNWEGVIGNTSPNHLNNLDYHTYGTTLADMTITDGSHSPVGVGTEVYFIHSYDERFSTMHVTTENNIQQAKYMQLVQFRQSYGAQGNVATDSINCYIVRLANPDTYVLAMACSSGQLPNNPGFKSQVHFASGVPEPGGGAGQTDTAIAFANNQFIWDIAVQKNGNYLFVSRVEVASPLQYAIWTVHKTTGATLQHNAALGYLTQRNIATNPVTGELWVIHSSGAEGTPRNTITKLTADGTGVLTASGVTITGLSDALNLEVSPDGSTLLVIDGGTAQQVKAFNTSDGSVKTAFGTAGVFGTAGGYAGSPAVTDTKFMFVPPSLGFGEPQGSFICFSAGGSFWIGDKGNYRYLHFSSGNSPALLDSIAYIPGYYSARDVRGDPTRVIANYLEFKIDYNKPLAPDNGSWTLANNWSAGVPLDGSGNPTYDQYSTLKWAGVYSNGRTYCFVRSLIVGWEPAEMTVTGLRLTGQSVSHQNNIFIDHAMNIWFVQSNTGGGSAVNVQKNPFTGFDGSGNPTWQFDPADPTFGPWPTVFTTEVLPANFPLIECQANHSSPVMETLANGIIPVYNAHSASNSGFGATGNHFGGIDAVTGKAMFSTHPPTPKNVGQTQTGLLFPEAPYFSVGYFPPPPGGSVGVDDFAGGSMLYLPGQAHVFTSYTGESWGNNQTNVWSHWHETGLLLGQFGPAAPYFGLSVLTNPRLLDGQTDYTAAINSADPSIMPIASPYSFKGMAGMAGNAFNGGLTFVNGSYFLYHNDEWYHAGLHRWRVDGIDSLTITSQNVTWGGVYTPPAPNSSNLLEGLPYNSANLPNNTAGWVRSPAANIGTGTYPGGPIPFWDVTTNTIIADPFKTPDLMFRALLQSTGTVATLTKAIPRHNTGNWTIDAAVVYPADNNGPDLHILILDRSGKRIARLYNSFNEHTSVTNFWVNTAATNTPPWSQGIASAANQTFWKNYASNVLPLTITGNVGNGTLAVTFGKYTIANIAVYDAGADIAAPAAFRIECDGTQANAAGYMILTKLNFIDGQVPPPGQGGLTTESGVPLVSEDGTLLIPG